MKLGPPASRNISNVGLLRARSGDALDMQTSRMNGLRRLPEPASAPSIGDHSDDRLTAAVVSMLLRSGGRPPIQRRNGNPDYERSRDLASTLIVPVATGTGHRHG